MKPILCAALVVFSLAGCGDAGGDYVGQWVSVQSDCSTMDVQKNGSGYLIKVDAPGILSREKYSFPATLKDGALSVDIGGQTRPLIIDQKTGNLLISGDEYRRLKGDKKAC